MRTLVTLAFLVSLALAHGESQRARPGGGTIIVPHGGADGPTTGGKRSARGTPGPVTVRPDSSAHTWVDWWAYHREYILADRARGRPITGIQKPKENRNQRRQRIYDICVRALGDKNQRVRASAAIALGKIGWPEADRYLTRHLDFPPEKWFTVREAAFFGVGLLGLGENRKRMLAVAGDKERATKVRSLALTSLMMDGTQASADMLVWHLRYFRSGIQGNATTTPHRSEQDRRRFAAHLLGYSELDGYNQVLYSAATGAARKWGPGEQGLAITALGRRKATEYKEEFFRMLYKRELDKEVRRSAVIALGMMIDGTSEADVKRLGRFLRDSRHDNIAQHFTVMALGQIGGPIAVDILVDALDRKVFGSPDDRGFLYLALGLNGKSKKARDTLVGRYGNARNWRERGALAVACGLAHARDAIPITHGYLDRASVQSDGYLGWGALGLGLGGATGSVKRIGKLFDKYHVAHIRSEAALALVLLQDKKALPRLLRLLREEGSLAAKAAVVAALSQLVSVPDEAIDALYDAYRDDSFPDSVRGLAIVSLGALADPRAVPVSALLVRNYNYFIRCQALDQIAVYL